MSVELKIGNFVQLKSGGPVMTVTRAPDSGSDMLSAEWFDGGELKQANFSVKNVYIYTRVGGAD